LSSLFSAQNKKSSLAVTRLLFKSEQLIFAAAQD